MSSNYPPGVTGCEPEIVGTSGYCYDCGKVTDAGPCPGCGKVFCLPCAESPDVACCCDEPPITRFDLDRTVAQARSESAKEHARMVREAATHLHERELYQAVRGNAERTMDYAFARRLVEGVAQAIEKGAK